MNTFLSSNLYRFVFVLGLLGARFCSFGQDVVLKTQADVDAFDPETTVINGYLQIGSSNNISDPISDLSNLTNITIIGGNIFISYNAQLTNIDGLSNLISVDRDLYITNNAHLTNIDGLSNITSIGGLIIEDNAQLTNVDGLSNITSVGKNLTLRSNAQLMNVDGLSNITSVGVLSNITSIGGLIIEDNAQLTNVDGLSNLTSIGGLRINANAQLTNIDGLSNITSVGGLGINGNAQLTNVDGLSNITNVGGGLIISSNAQLTNVDGLSNLTSVGVLSNIISIGGGLTISSNSQLTNIDGLSNLTSVVGSLTIRSNDQLKNVDGLSSVISLSGYGTLDFRDNAQLKNVDGLSNITSVDHNVFIFNNDQLKNVDGLSSVISVGDLIIKDNAQLSNVDGLSNITIVGEDLIIRNNAQLTNVDGLSNLTSVGVLSSTTIVGDLIIEDNAQLTNVDGLSNLTSVGINLIIGSNAQLTNVDGLSNIKIIGNYLIIRNNAQLTNCCGIQNLLKDQSSSIGGIITISNNPSECSSETEVLATECGLGVAIDISSSCVDEDNGSIQVFVSNYDTIPFSFQWQRQEDGLTSNGVSESDNFTIGSLGVGTYNITVTNPRPDTVILTDIVISADEGNIFEVIEIKTTNSSNGQSNGSINITTAGGTEPYSYSWSGPVSGSMSGISTENYTISSLGYGEYTVVIEDSNGASKSIQVSLLDEEVQVVPCERPLDILVLNDVSGSVDATEYSESKQFFVDFLNEVNIGTGSEQSRAAIVEWSSGSSQKLKISLTGEISELNNYLDNTRAFSGGTSPHEAMTFGDNYLENNARPDVEKVIILSTDGSTSQISNSLVAFADELKAKGYHIISIAFDNAFSSTSTREILRKIASVDALAPGAPAYSQLDTTLAKNIVNNYLCPIDPGSSATAYFNRDGAIDILDINPLGNCPYPDFIEVTIEVSAHRELSLPAGTPVTFYHNNPNLFGATPILTWQIPCAIPVDSVETYTITLPIDGPSNIYAVLNDDGMQGPPISFPITEIDELAYSNNIDNERVCLDGEATVQAIKYITSTIPSCDTIVNYTINVCNVSEIDAFGVTVEDIPPTGFVLAGSVFNDNGCAIDQSGSYDIPAVCCFSLSLTYDAASADFGYYGDQGVNLDGPSNQTYIDFDGSTTTDEDITLDGTIDCPSTTIEFTKSVNVDESCDDGFVEFSFTINNELNIPLQGLVFTDILPDPCAWVYRPYGESGLAIGEVTTDGNEVTFTIDQVNANTEAIFYMDANLGIWASDGTLTNTATIDNVPDVVNGGYQTLTSNTTTTQITTAPKIDIPDTIIVDSALDTVALEAILSSAADISWTTSGDGEFTDENDESTVYILGSEDILDRYVSLFISITSECGETGQEVTILFDECSEDNDFDIQLAAADLMCEADYVEIMVASNFTLDSVFWSGPSDEGLNGNNLLASLPGVYTLVGYSGGCTDTTSIIIDSSPTIVMDTFTICEGESLEINNEVYTVSGSYQQAINSTDGCDTLLHIELEVLDDEVTENTYILQTGETIEINGIVYDSEGIYMQDLMGTNGCDSTLIIVIIEDQSLITFDFDDCLALIQTMENADYTEFIPHYNNELECGSVSSTNIYREDPFENKHSCTEGLNNSYSMCISSDPSCEFDENSTKMIKMKIEINPEPNKEIVISAIEFYQKAPEQFDWINGADGDNNYPTKYGLRILKNNEEIYRSENNATTQTWQKEVFNLTNNDDFIFTDSSILEIQILPYCLVGVDSPVTAWDLEDLKISGTCSTGSEDMKMIAGSVEPYVGQMLQDVQIFIATESTYNQLSIDENGDYATADNLINSKIHINAYKNDDHLYRVNTIDLIMIQRHLLGLEKLENPLQYIAADVNYDGRISPADLLDLHKLILGIYTELPRNLSYRFIDKTEVLKHYDEPWKMSENIKIENLTNHIIDADFKPVKIGDVSYQDIELSADISNTLNIVKKESIKDSKYTLDVNLANPVHFNGLQFSIDLKGLDFEKIETSLNNFTEDNYNITEEGILNISWVDLQNENNLSSHLFTLHFNKDSEVDISDNIIMSEVYSNDLIYKLESSDITTQKDTESISNLQVYPNPINDETIVSFDHNVDSKVEFSVHSLEGKLIYEESLNSKTGHNKFQLPEIISQKQSGIFIIQLTDGYTTESTKIVVIN